MRALRLLRCPGCQKLFRRKVFIKDGAVDPDFIPHCTPCDTRNAISGHRYAISALELKLLKQMKVQANRQAKLEKEIGR